MKIKKFVALALAALLLLTVAGCGAKSSMNTSQSYDAMESPMAGGYRDNGMVMEDAALDYGMADSTDKEMEMSKEESSGSSTTSTADTPYRKLIRKINLDAETEELDALLFAINSKVSALGGYIEEREVYTGSHYASYEPSRRAYMVIRVPADRLDEFVSHISETSNVISSNETSEDVTLTYVATQSRMTALQKEEARLLTLIDKAANLTELLELEKRLTEVRSDLEYVTSQLRMYDNLVDYGTVTVNISEVKKLTPVAEPGFWQRMGSGFMESLNNLWIFMKELAIFLVVASPYLIPLAAVIVVIVLIIRRSANKKKVKTTKRKPPFPTEDTEE